MFVGAYYNFSVCGEDIIIIITPLCVCGKFYVCVYVWGNIPYSGYLAGGGLILVVWRSGK